MKAILGQKVGMTQFILENGKVVPVTVVWAPSCVAVQKKTAEVDGYDAVQVGYGEIKEKNVNKPIKGHFAKAGVAPTRHLREFSIEAEVGNEIAVDTFAAGDMVDVSGTSKGKGFAGVIKKGASRGPETHGSKSHRAIGSLGMCSDPSRIFKGKRMPGQMGNVRVTVQNLEVVSVDKENNLLVIKGAIPGPNKGVVEVRSAVKAG